MTEKKKTDQEIKTLLKKKNKIGGGQKHKKNGRKWAKKNG